MVKSVKTTILLLSAALACSCSHDLALEKVADALKSAKGGDTLYVKSGEYNNLDLKWEGRGTCEAPVVVMAREKGGVVIGGTTKMHISGEGLEINGLVFRGGHIDKGAVIEFKNGDSLAQNCHMTECVVDSYNPARRDVLYSYVHLYGRNNRVDHCSFLGKKSLGVTLIVMLNYSGCIENNHSVDHNYFGPRPVYGSNGAETIRVGTSQQCMENSRTHIHDNLFEGCNGEVEVISIKSCENVIEHNVLYECQGVLALRHGDRNIARENIFIGNGIRNTGGIRIVGEDQQVLGNRMYGIAGTRFFSAFALMCGVPNSLPNRYMQVKNTIVRDNLLSDCASIDLNCGADFERTLGAVGTVWENNTVCKGEKAPEIDPLREGKGAAWYQAPVVTREKKTIILSEPEVVLTEAITVDCPTEIIAAEGVRPHVTFAGSKGDNMVTIKDGGSLKIKGIDFDGRLADGKALAKAGICTDVDMIEPYTLTVEDCSFRNFGESGFIPVRGLKGTFADSVVVRGCYFEALSGDAISFAAESDDKGRYNADDMFIENCTFGRILGIPVNIYRGGSDESTAGPYVHIRDCKFNDSCNKVRGSVIRITGAQVLDITGCSFKNSGRGGYAIRLDDAPWEVLNVSGNSFVNSGRIQSNRNL